MAILEADLLTWRTDPGNYIKVRRQFPHGPFVVSLTLLGELLTVTDLRGA